MMLPSVPATSKAWSRQWRQVQGQQVPKPGRVPG